MYKEPGTLVPLTGNAIAYMKKCEKFPEQIESLDRDHGHEIQELEVAEALRIGGATETKLRLPHGAKELRTYSLFEVIALSRENTDRKAVPLPSAKGGSR